MNEDFLAYLWKHQYFNKENLQTTDFQLLKIVNTGNKNTDSGADFQNVSIVLQNMQWFGSAEIHINANDWQTHKHHENKAYDNVILHIVWKNNSEKPMLRKDNSPIPTLELQPLVDPLLIEKYHLLLSNPNPILCASQIPNVPEFIVKNAFSQALQARLNRKSDQIIDLLKRNKNDWEETSYQILMRNFGFKINADAFFQLANALPFKILQKHSDNLFQIEALLFGQADLIDIKDNYSEKLWKEYDFLAKKYQITDQRLQKHQWKFLRMRPANFPTVRLAQMAALLQTRKANLANLLPIQSKKELYQLFDFQLSSYWQSHYHFGKTSKKTAINFGKNSTENVLLNTISPLLAAWAKQKQEEIYLEKAMIWLNYLPKEQNHIIETWEKAEVKIKTAAESQAGIEIFNEFCSKKRCLDCEIGRKLLGK